MSIVTAIPKIKSGKQKSFRADNLDQSDFGPDIRFARGDVVRDDRPDIDDHSAYKRTIRGARRNDGLRTALSCGNIDYPQWLAGERFRNDLEIADGARDRQFGMVVDGGLNCEPSQAQIDAMRRVREALAAVSEGNRFSVRSVVVHYWSLDKIARAKRGRVVNNFASAKECLQGGLDELAAYYGARRRTAI